MPSKLKLKWIAALFAAAALLALPAAAQATLTYVKNPFNSTVFVASDDGSGAHKVGKGYNAHVSPDGLTVVFLHEGKNHAQEMWAVPAAGGASRTLLKPWRDSYLLAYSPDSKTIAAMRGPELGKRKLILIDVATGAQRLIATGFFSGFSFSPDSTELVYSMAGSERYPPRSDIYRAATVGGKPVRITKDQISQDPLWGPNGKIVFVKMLGAKKRKYGPKSELFLMNPEGKQVKRLTHTKVGALLVGLFPTDWSADGTRLLAEFQGQDTSYAVTVNPQTGAQRTVKKAGEVGFVGTALSADGTTVLGFTGGFEPGPNRNVATVPYSGGKLKVLVENAFEPDWSR
ncbi:MAG: hypothetical protein WD810_02105 [Solirubrobacterales bacterium]